MSESDNHIIRLARENIDMRTRLMLVDSKIMDALVNHILIGFVCVMIAFLLWAILGYNGRKPSTPAYSTWMTNVSQLTNTTLLPGGGAAIIGINYPIARRQKDMISAIVVTNYYQLNADLETWEKLP